jgi:hypothetical protein
MAAGFTLRPARPGCLARKRLFWRKKVPGQPQKGLNPSVPWRIAEQARIS